MSVAIFNLFAAVFCYALAAFGVHNHLYGYAVLMFGLGIINSILVARKTDG